MVKVDELKIVTPIVIGRWIIGYLVLSVASPNIEKLRVLNNWDTMAVSVFVCTFYNGFMFEIC